MKAINVHKLIKSMTAIFMIVVMLMTIFLTDVSYANSSLINTSNTVTIVFNVNGGNALKSDSLTVNRQGRSKIIFPCPTHPDPRYTFVGWYLNPQSANRIWSEDVRDYIEFDEEEIYQINELTLYAKWDLLGKKVTVKSNKNQKRGKYKNKKIEIVVTNWKIKKNPKIKLDLKAYSKAGYKWAPFDIKIGTATLKSPAKQNMVLESSFYDKLICYKGKKTADVYVRHNFKIPKKKKYGKKFTIKDSFKYDSMSCQCGEDYCQFIKNYKNKVHNFNFTEIYNSELEYQGDIYTFYKNRHVFRTPGSYVKAPTKESNYKVTIINKKQKLGKKLNKKSRLYKKANKMVGMYSSSCIDTSWKLWKRVTVDGFGDGTGGVHSAYVTIIPVSNAKPGDWLSQKGHDSIYLGGGQSLHGSVTSHKTWIGPSNIRAIGFAARSNYFWFYKKAYNK